MAFPITQRVLYRVNPLDEVICQLRFPPVLRIDSETPATFQDRLRAEYPFYEAKGALRLPPSMPSEVAKVLSADLPLGGQKSHEFTSRDRQWTMSLTREFLALTCRQYERWEKFRERLTFGVTALRDLYAPPFYTRIGLRYRDVIRRSAVGMSDDAPWSRLLQPWVTGPLGSPDTMGDVEGVQTASLVRVAEANGFVQIRNSLALDEETKEQVFLIDADFFADQQTETEHAFDQLNALNRQARLFFRWCITDDLHTAMGPAEVL